MNLARGAKYFQGRLPFTSIDRVIDNFERWFFGRFLEAQQAVKCGGLDQPISLAREAYLHIAELHSECTIPNALTPRDAYITGCLLLYIQTCIAKELTNGTALATLDDLLTLLSRVESDNHQPHSPLEGRICL